MSTGPGRRGRSSRAERRTESLDRLQRSAESLTADGGSFSALPVERLAAGAGMSRATFYIYFEDKAELVTSWFAQLAERITEAGEPWWGAVEPVTPDTVRATLAAVLAVYQRHRTVFAAVEEMVPLDPRLREVVEAEHALRVRQLAAHVRHGQEGGWIDSVLLADETAQWLTVMIERVATGVAVTDADAAAALAESGAGVVWRALYARVAD
ncbi:TetR/AcrR family transcriptional regulator [Pseudonocardia sp. RS010]|uniref:TetR/AcrR family transcriptional regulator n=1 Tax=Pseudonocardia sp. RS010 TaxID=3385979 RepID=UPI0039A0AC18